MMQVRLGGCCPCCPCCLANGGVIDEDGPYSLCYHYETSGNALINATEEYRNATGFQYVQAGSNGRYATLVSVRGNYTDPDTGLEICWILDFCLGVFCEGDAVKYSLHLPTVSALGEFSNYSTAPDAPADCRLAWFTPAGDCGELPTGLPTPLPPADITGTLGSADDCDAGWAPIEFELTLPGHAGQGIDPQTFTVTLDLAEVPTLSSECPFLDDPGSEECCVPPFDPDPDPGGDTVVTNCCGGYAIPRNLNFAITSLLGGVPVPGTACGGCLDLFGGLAYQNALGAWVANLLTCGEFGSLAFYCVFIPPSINEFGIDLRCGGVQIGTPAQNVGSCQPMDLQFGIVIPAGAPCCQAGGSLILRVYE